MRVLRSGIVLILAGYIALALAYSVINPLHEGTDELRHFRFVRTIAASGRLPVQGQEPCRSQSHHPPLFYAVGALATAWIESGHDLCQAAPENPFCDISGQHLTVMASRLKSLARFLMAT